MERRGIAEAGDFHAGRRSGDDGLGTLLPGAESVVGGDGEALGFAEVIVAVGERGFGWGDGLDAGIDDGRGSVVEDGGAGEAAVGVGTAGGGCEGDGKALPVNHVGAGGVGPVHVAPDGGVRVVLVEHVVLALPIDGTAWVVDPASGGQEVTGGALGVLERGFGLRLGEGIFHRVGKGASGG